MIIELQGTAHGVYLPAHAEIIKKHVTKAIYAEEFDDHYYCHKPSTPKEPYFLICKDDCRLISE